MRHWLQLIRWPNLLIVALTMYLLHHNLFLPAFQKFNISPTLSIFQFSLLVFMTVLATAAGYVVNDWFDYSIDIINKPSRIIINKKITWRTARRFYLGLVVVGAFISSYLAAKSGLWGIAIIYNLVTILLFFYARYLKRMFLIGNVVVALLCALVVALVWYVNSESIAVLHRSYNGEKAYLRIITVAYFLFSFLITLYREIVKDMEDIAGDQRANAQTLPIVLGMEATKKVAGFIVVGLLLGLGFWIEAAPVPDHYLEQFIFGLVLFGLLSVSLVLLLSAKEKHDYGRLSLVIKVVILMGVLWLGFL